MADNEKTTKGQSAGRDKTKDAEILKEARSRWDRAYDKERDNIKAAYEDLEFLVGGDAQWDSASLRDRRAESRPCLTVNQLPQFVHQVTGDIRQMKPSIKVVPVDDAADPQVADINAGLIRYIENRSDAPGVYFQAADQQVGAGIGHWRVITEYADDSTFNQEIRITGVDDGVSVLWDPDAKMLTKDDSTFCFVPVDFTHEGFKELWPDANCSDFSTLTEWANLQEWHTNDRIRVVEYWVKKPAKRTLALLPDGKILDLTDKKEQTVLPPETRVEKRDSYKVCRYLMTGMEILEGPTEWPGRHIPIVPAIGEEVRVNGKTIRKGIIRDAKDPQRMYNYFRSAQTEVVALQPKAPFMVTERNVAKYQDVWESANTKNWPYLPYEPDQQNGGASPQRVQPPVSSQGVNEGVMLANEDLRRVIGIYDASLGAKSNETSGKAIMARQREGDTGTYVYIDNFARAIRRTGQILIDLIPHVYDTERTIRIMGEDGKIDMLRINQAQMQADPSGTMVEHTLNDVTVGSYDVVAQIGPSYTSRREEAKEGMLELAKAAPNILPVILDKIVKAQDWPMADEIAKRIRATMPQNILQAEEAEEQGAPPEEVKAILAQGQQPPPDPKIIALQQKAELDSQKMQFEQQKAMQDMQLEMANLRIEMEKMRIDAMTKVEVAQINAGVGMHKTVVDAATAQHGAMISAEQAQRAAEMQDATTRHQIETRANVDHSRNMAAAENQRYAAERRAPQQ